MHSIFRRKDIRKLHADGTKVYSYLNIGSVENFRPYYKTYEHLAIGDYENWEEEKWVNVADKDWQEFMDTLAGKLKKKGVDGFFIDNCDVYDYAHKKDIFDGLTVIFKENPGNGETGSGQWRRYLCDGISVPLWFCCGYYDGCKPGVGVEQD